MHPGSDLSRCPHCGIPQCLMSSPAPAARARGHTGKPPSHPAPAWHSHDPEPCTPHRARDVTRHGMAAGGPRAMESLWGHQASRHLCGPWPRTPPFPGNESHVGHRAPGSPTSGPDFRTPRSPGANLSLRLNTAAGNTYMAPPQTPVKNSTSGHLQRAPRVSPATVQGHKTDAEGPEV